MLLLNPFQRRTYTFRTILAPEACSKRVITAMDAFNDSSAARRRYVKATMFDERFTARVEPLSLGSSGGGNLMRLLVVEAVGTFHPSRDGTVTVVIGFDWRLSLFQLAWRVLCVCLVALIIWATAMGGILVARMLVVAGLFAVVILPWSLVALVQGMRQASKDWSSLLDFAQEALGSHASSAG